VIHQRFVIVIKIFDIARITKRTWAHYNRHKRAKKILKADLKNSVLSCFLKVDKTSFGLEAIDDDCKIRS
jgi:hypothetical protein